MVVRYINDEKDNNTFARCAHSSCEQLRENKQQGGAQLCGAHRPGLICTVDYLRCIGCGRIPHL